jgi:hypothetical protein
MTYRIYGAFIASLGVVALMLGANEAFARSGAAPGRAFASAHSISHRHIPQSLRHHRRNNVGFIWPGDAGFFPSNGEPPVDVTQPAPGDVRYSNTPDIPWDWAHRYPPNVMPSDRPYVSSCSTEPVTVPGRHGERTINITRCY